MAQKNADSETLLVGKQVAVRSLDWQRQMTGKLMKVEKYSYVLETDKGTLTVLKHACGVISAVEGKN